MQTQYTAIDIARFWGHVDKEHSDFFYNGSRCWEWTANIPPTSGYGLVKLNKKERLVHRVAYEITFGEIGDDLLVLHHCDNRPCVNPDHLFLGTQKDNVADMMQKGRKPLGEEHANSKLSAAQVFEIRKRYRRFGIGGDTTVTLAKEFGVSAKTISNIVNRKKWK